MKVNIRNAVKSDEEAIWKIIQKVIATGDTYVFSPDSGREEMINYWCGPDKHTFVAEVERRVVGTFILKDNFPGLGAHVANGSYMTLPEAFGRGIGRAMGEFSIEEAGRLGYKAIQFNAVVKNNSRAVKLWQKLGFEIKGEIPGAFKHRDQGFVDLLIMWRKI